MKGYKAFKKGMICRDKQYAENTVFEEDSAEVCRSGMHFCKEPLDVLDYYPLVDDNGDMTEFAEVEALDEPKTDDNKKFCTKKLKIGAKLKLGNFIKASFDVLYEKATKDNSVKSIQDSAANSGDNSQLAASGDNSQLAASGNYSQLAASGYNSKLAASGDNSKLAASGNYSQLAASGDNSKLAASGYNSKLAASGYNSKLAASGNYSQLAASGNYSQLAASGYNSKLAASGYSSQLAASGDNSQIISTGKHSVICCAGHNCTAKGKVGSWLTLSEWEYSEEEKCYIPVCVKTEQIDGERVKEDTYYKLKNGEFVEVSE